MAKIVGQHTPLELKNLAINGALDFFQRNEGNSINVATAVSNAYHADMIKYNAGGTTSKTFSVQRSATVPTQVQSGFNSTFSTAFIMTTGISLAAGDFIVPFQYNMEGNDYERIHNKPAITFGFWIYATVPGTYNFAMGNAGGTRAYATTFNVAATLTWQFVSISVPTDSTGTWAFDTTLGLAVYVAGVAGITNTVTTANAWQTVSNAGVAVSGSTNWAATSGAVVQIAQFSIVEGPLGFNATGFQRQGKSMQQEFALCQRYFGKTFPLGTAPAQASGNTTDALQSNISSAAGFYSSVTWCFPVSMRATPSITTYNPTQANANFRNQTNTADSAVNGGIFTTIRSAYINSTNTFAANTWGQIHAAAEAGL